MILKLTIVLLVCNFVAVIFGRSAPNYNRNVHGHHGNNITYGFNNNFNKGHHNGTYYHHNGTYYNHNGTFVRPYNNNTRLAFGPHSPISG